MCTLTFGNVRVTTRGPVGRHVARCIRSARCSARVAMASGGVVARHDEHDGKRALWRRRAPCGRGRRPAIAIMPAVARAIYRDSALQSRLQSTGRHAHLDCEAHNLRQRKEECVCAARHSTRAARAGRSRAEHAAVRLTSAQAKHRPKYAYARLVSLSRDTSSCAHTISRVVQLRRQSLYH
jgi:hypothetical protein